MGMFGPRVLIRLQQKCLECTWKGEGCAGDWGCSGICCE